MTPPKAHAGRINMRPTRIAIVSNTSWSLVNFRGRLIQTLVREGFEVLAIAPTDDYSAQLAELGARHVSMPMDNGGTNPIKDLGLFFRLLAALARHKPDVMLGFTAKPNIYGSLAARLLNIPTVNNIAGLGSVFSRNDWLTKLVRGLYATALKKAHKVFFQNMEDQQSFIEGHLVRPVQAERLPGSGVDLSKFSMPEHAVAPSHDVTSTFRFLLIARMLWDKGVADYVQAARLLRQRGHRVECCMLGFADVRNPSAIPRTQIELWASDGAVNYLGATDDVGSIIASSHCVVLPSYYKEGVPRSLLESAAMQRPIITTDLSGCRDAVEHGLTGFLCQARDPAGLAELMEHVLSLSSEDRSAMGRAGRAKMEREFDEHRILQAYLQAIRSAPGLPPASTLVN